MTLAAIAAAIALPAAAHGSTITVTTSADENFVGGNTGCSLREAVTTAAVNMTIASGCTYPAGSPDDTITFASAAIDPVLTIAPVNTDDNASGDLDVQAAPLAEGTLTIHGLGQGATTIDGGDVDRVLHLLGGTLTIDDLTLTGGDSAGAASAGGAIRAAPGPDPTDSLFLSNVAITNSDSGTGGGGGVGVQDGAVTISNSTISGNATVGSGGGIQVTGGANVTITDTTVSGNHANGANAIGGGVSILSADSFSFDGGQISGNDLGAGVDLDRRGGGLAHADPGGTGTVTGATISGNFAGGGAGGGIANTQGTLNVDDSTISGNSAASFGAGITAGGSATNVSGSAVTGTVAETNSAAHQAGGGGVHNYTTATITDTTVSGNRVADTAANASSLSGAGLSSAANLMVDRSTVSGNFFDGAPHFAAAIASNSASSNLTLLNSTVTGNVETDPFGSTISGFQANTTVRILQSTIAGNSHDPGGNAIEFPGTDPPPDESITTIRGSIVDDDNGCRAGNPEGLMASAGFNVYSDATCPFVVGDTANANPLLGPLGNNGGPTQTFGLLAGSPALDRVPLASCDDELGNPLTVDQRGFPRMPSPPGGLCDSGAYEGVFVPAPPQTTTTSTGTPAPPAKKKCKRKKKKKGKRGKCKRKKKKKRR